MARFCRTGVDLSLRPNFEKSWEQTWADLQLQPPPGLLDELLRAYSEPQRRYHSQQHLHECLSHFDDVRGLAERPGEVAFALWFHDAIYDVQGKSNERESADWALRVLRQVNADADVQRRIERLIMVTTHDAVPEDNDQKLLIDIDLSILGATPDRFDEYDRQVRAEYDWVPEEIYEMKRKEILKSFLDRPRIYNTSYFTDRYEAQARINLASVI